MGQAVPTSEAVAGCPEPVGPPPAGVSCLTLPALHQRDGQQVIRLHLNLGLGPGAWNVFLKLVATPSLPQVFQARGWLDGRRRERAPDGSASGFLVVGPIHH